MTREKAEQRFKEYQERWLSLPLDELMKHIADGIRENYLAKNELLRQDAKHLDEIWTSIEPQLNDVKKKRRRKKDEFGQAMKMMRLHLDNCQEQEEFVIDRLLNRIYELSNEIIEIKLEQAKGSIIERKQKLEPPTKC